MSPGVNPAQPSSSEVFEHTGGISDMFRVLSEEVGSRVSGDPSIRESLLNPSLGQYFTILYDWVMGECLPILSPEQLGRLQPGENPAILHRGPNVDDVYVTFSPEGQLVELYLYTPGKLDDVSCPNPYEDTEVNGEICIFLDYGSISRVYGQITLGESGVEIGENNVISSIKVGGSFSVGPDGIKGTTYHRMLLVGSRVAISHHLNSRYKHKIPCRGGRSALVEISGSFNKELRLAQSPEDIIAEERRYRHSHLVLDWAREVETKITRGINGLDIKVTPLSVEPIQPLYMTQSNFHAIVGKHRGRGQDYSRRGASWEEFRREIIGAVTRQRQE